MRKLLAEHAQIGGLARVDAHGLVVGGDHAYDVSALLGVEVVQIGLVLEVVGIQAAVLHGGVGHHVVVEFHDLQSYVMLGQNGGGILQNLGVGAGEAPTFRVTGSVISGMVASVAPMGITTPL